MSTPSEWQQIGQARTDWQQADRAIPALRAVHGALDDLTQTIRRGRFDRADPDSVFTGLDSLEAGPAPAFLAEPVLADGQTVKRAFEQGRAVTPAADTVASALEAASDGAVERLRTALEEVVRPPEGPMAVDTTAVEQLTDLFGLAVEAGIAAREDHATRLQASIETAYDEIDDPLPDLDEQPIALLPVRLETRFVDDDWSVEAEPTQLLVRVFPDQIHADSHEPGLTADELRWGQTFWATLWYAHHPVPAGLPDDPSAPYLQDRLPERHLREHVAEIDPEQFSDPIHDRYAELKERAWNKLLDRFGPERSAYIVHALEPDDERLAHRLLTQPDAPETAEQKTSGEGRTGGEKASGDETAGEDSGRTEGSESAIGERLSEQAQAELAREPVSGLELVDDLGTVPALSFPSVDRKPESWTRQPRARLLPDRWIAIAEWTADGETKRTAVAGRAIREPLPLGPSPESVASEDLASQQTDSPAPDGTEWMVDFEQAQWAGMGLRIRLDELAGFDPARGFERVTVLGVNGTTSAHNSATALRELLDGHHYTDGLELLEPGTPTNVGEGMDSPSPDPIEHECAPPLLESGDGSDADLLARALSIDPETVGDARTGVGSRHVFGNVANADATAQRDARHANSALWPATMGYYLRHLLVDNAIVGYPSYWDGTMHDPGDMQRRYERLVGAYRRHFIRYVRGRGPFPTLRVGDQPYGVLPATAVETERDLTVVDHDLVADLGQGVVEFDNQESLSSLLDAGIGPDTLVEAGADPDSVVDAGADPTDLVAGVGHSPVSQIDPVEVTPDAVLQDGIGVTRTSRLDRERLDAAGIDPDDLSEAGITPADLARGDVTDEQLESAGITTENIAAVLLPPEARELGITPRSLKRAGITPGALLRGEVTAEHCRRLGLSTRGLAELVLPPQARDLGLSPRALEDAGVSPADLLNGDVSAEDLERAGVTTEQLATLLLPEEVVDTGITPEQVGEAVDLADLFNGDVDVHDLEEAGLSTQTLADAMLPQSVREAGITPDSLEAAGITPAAIVNGQVTPEDVVEAGVTPDALAEAGVLPDALASVGSELAGVVETGLDPAALIERGLSAEPLLDAGVAPNVLVEAGLAPARLLEAGLDAAELVADGVPFADLVGSGVGPDQLARLGATVEELSGGNVPADELVQAGFEAVDLLQQGADALGVAQGGARPSDLQRAGVDAGTLREAGKAAGSLRRAGYDPAALLDGGYTAQELLNGGYQPEDLRAAGVDPDTIESAGRSVSELLGSGYPVADLREQGYGPDQLLDGGVTVGELVDAGYTAGELVDAEADPERLLEAGLPAGDIRAAGVSLDRLVEAGVDPQTLAAAGASAQFLLDHGFDPEQLLDAGLGAAELEVAGVDVDALLADTLDAGGESATASDASAADDVTLADIVGPGSQYAATVLERPEQADEQLYSFSFDPAVSPRSRPESRSRSRGNRDEGERDGDNRSRREDDDRSRGDGGGGKVPVSKPLAVDDRVPLDLQNRVSGLGSEYDRLLGLTGDGSMRDPDIMYSVSRLSAFERNGRADDRDADGALSSEGLLVQALKRSGVSQSVRQKTWLYSYAAWTDDEGVNQVVREMGHEGSMLPNTDGTPTHQFVSATGMDDLDPRLAYLTMFPERGLNPERTKTDFWTLANDLRGKYRSTITEPQIAERGLGGFVDILLDSTLEELRPLGAPLDLSGFEPSEEFAKEVDWSSLDHAERVEATLDRIEETSEGDGGLMDAAGVAGDLFDSLPTDSLLEPARLGALIGNQQQYGDTGYLHSLVRVLLHFGTIHAYANGRARLGAAYDDPPDGIPELGDGTAYPTDGLDDPTPAALDAHPNVNRDDDEEYSYFQALQEATTPYLTSTSIEPRMAEFADSLRYLADRDPETLSALTRETLDLCSHRLDAWWSSLATKRLFELRETQQAIASGELDPGGGSEIPRATLEPGLLSNLDLDTAGGIDPLAGSGQSDGTGQDATSGDATTEGAPSGDATGQDSTARFDPATIADTTISTDPLGDTTDESGTDGGIGPVDTGLSPVDSGGDGDSGTADTAAETTVSDLLSSGDVAKKTGDIDLGALSTTETPGLYVGGYGYVEHLSVDESGVDQPEYVHTPSGQQATTAALLRSGYEAHEQTDGENALAVDLSPSRVRTAMELIRGVRRGESLGALLGHRFERELRERTLWTDQDLMGYTDEFRAAFPTTTDSLDRPDETGVEDDKRRDQLAVREVVDGRKLVKQWFRYPFHRDLPGEDTDAYAVLEEIKRDLESTLDAVGDLLTAESVHQFAQGNFESAGASLDTLAKGTSIPDPEVVDTPRSHTGVAHRTCLLFGAHDRAETGRTGHTAPTDTRGDRPEATTPRTAAEPALSAWASNLLPAHDEVECVGTYRWEGGERTRSVTLAALDLGPLDVLSLFGADRKPARTEIEQRLVYHLVRTRPDAVPADAEIDLALGETDSPGAVSMASVLELAGSLRELVGTARPLTATDLAHPTDQADDGYDAQTATTLAERANEAQDALLDVATALDERLSVLDATHQQGDAIESVLAATRQTDGGDPGDLPGSSGAPLGGSGDVPGGWEQRTDTVTLPGSSPLSTTALESDESTVTEQVDKLVESCEAVTSTVPLDAAESATESFDPSSLRDELRSFAEALPAGPTDPDHVSADLTVAAAPDQSITGVAGDIAEKPAVDADTIADAVSDPSLDLHGPAFSVGSGSEQSHGDQSPGGGQSGDNTGLADQFVPGAQPTTSLPEQVGSFEHEFETAAFEAEAYDSVPIRVHVWGTDGLAWFHRVAETTTAADGSFEAEVDFDGIQPGTPFTVAATDKGEVLFTASGRVLGEAGDPQRALDQSEPLRALAWLHSRRGQFTGAPLSGLAATRSDTDWDAIRSERDGAPAESTVTQSDLDLIADLLGLADTDPAALQSAYERLVGLVSRLGLDELVTVTGEGGLDDSEVWYTETPAVGDVRARIRRVLQNPAAENSGAAPWHLSYHPRAAAAIRGQPAPDRLGAYLDAVLSGPGWVPAVLGECLDNPVGLLSRLSAYLYSTGRFEDEQALAANLETLADGLESMPSLALLFDGLATDDSDRHLPTFESHLRDLASAVRGGVQTPDSESAIRTFDEHISSATSQFTSELRALWPAVDAVAGTPVAARFRNLVLERLREPMASAAMFGVYGGTPAHPDGGDEVAEQALTEQAQALLERLRPRLTDAIALDPRLEPALENRPPAARVADQTDRLEALFGEEFTVLPPFAPDNGDELVETFTDDTLVPDALAGETLLQRVATVRERIETFRRTRSYAQALSGTITPSPTIGQVPYEPGDTWVGAEESDPAAGKLSLIAQLGPGVTPGTADGRLAGLFVDEWTESIPDESETTGVAVNYDDPGSRPPQSILLATPPEDGEWTLDHLAATVDETALYAKRRAVDGGDFSTRLFKFFPALFFPSYQSAADEDPAVGNVSFEAIAQYDRSQMDDLFTLFDVGGETR
jgi:hypothetical protein